MADKEFWERCGFYQSKRAYHYECGKRVPNWLCPDGSRVFRAYRFEGYLPSSDLDTLFRYAVPKFADGGVQFVYEYDCCRCYVYTWGHLEIVTSPNNTGNIADSYALSAQALRQAIEQVMEAE